LGAHQRRTRNNRHSRGGRMKRTPRAIPTTTMSTPKAMATGNPEAVPMTPSASITPEPKAPRHWPTIRERRAPGAGGRRGSHVRAPIQSQPVPVLWSVFTMRVNGNIGYTAGIIGQWPEGVDEPRRAGLSPGDGPSSGRIESSPPVLTCRTGRTYVGGLTSGRRVNSQPLG